MPAGTRLSAEAEDALNEAVPGCSAPMCTTEVYEAMKAAGAIRIGTAWRRNDQTGELEEY